MPVPLARFGGVAVDDEGALRIRSESLRELTMAPLNAGELHVELGGGYLPWGRVGVREVHACEGYVHDVAHDVAVVVLSMPVPDDVPLFELTYDLPREAGVFELAGFGSDKKAREIPLTGWYVSSVSRHVHRGPVLTVEDGSMLIRVPGSPGDSGGPIVDTATGRLAGVVSRGRSGKTDKTEDGDAGYARVAGARLIDCKAMIETALAR